MDPRRATRIFYPFILFFQKAYLTLASHQCGPGSNTGVDAIMWVKFVVGFLLCTKRFLSEYFGCPLFFKTNTFKFQFDLERTDMFQRVLNNSQVFVGKQITPKKMAPVVETLDSAIHRRNPYRWETIVRKQEISTADQKDQPNCVIHWIEIYPVDNDWTNMLVPMLSLHCMALHFFRRNHGPESTVGWI